jgi:hypothetical protein
MIKLRTASWSLRLHKTIVNASGEKVDMYTLLDDREIDPETTDIVSIGVPHGRADIAAFIARSIAAGQKVLQTLPLGHQMIPDEQPGFEKVENDGDASTVPEE